MKFKVMALILVSLFVSSVCFAVSDEVSDLWKTIEINNTGGTYQTTVLSTVNGIRPGYDKVLGWTVQGRSLNSENFVAVYDSATSILTGEILGESESLPETVDGRWFPTPRKVVNGVSVRQGPNTKVFIYYTSL